jgi:hypothetical protein
VGNEIISKISVKNNQIRAVWLSDITRYLKIAGRVGSNPVRGKIFYNQ